MTDLGLNGETQIYQYKRIEYRRRKRKFLTNKLRTRRKRKTRTRRQSQQQMNARISRDEKILSFSVLIVAVFSASTAGAIFSVLEDEPLFSQQKGDKSAMLLASSRLTATAIVQSPIFLYCCYNYYHYRGGGGGRGERIYGRGRRRTSTQRKR